MRLKSHHKLYKMKRKIITTLTILILLFSSVFAQTPQVFKYQAVARNATGALITNQAVSLQISILQGSAGGSSVYTETHAITSNAYGLVNLEIGNGSAISGTFANIDWATGPYFVQVEMDETGGTTYQLIGTFQLLSVPYALYAESSGSSGSITLAAGSDKQLIINDGGVAGSDAELVYDKTSNHMAIGTSVINPTAALEINSTSGGLLMPRMTTVQRNTFTPEKGTMIYNTTDDKLQIFTSGSSSGLHVDPGSNQVGTGNGWFVSKAISSGGYSSEWLGQSFTAQTSGVMEKVSLSIGGVSGPNAKLLRLQVYSGTNMNSLLATETFTVEGTAFLWYDIPLTSTPAVFSGETYIFILSFANICDATGYNVVQWQRNTSYASYPRNWSYSNYSGNCPIVPNWSAGDNNNRYIFKAWVNGTFPADQWIDLW